MYVSHRMDNIGVIVNKEEWGGNFSRLVGQKNCLVFLAILIVQKYFKTHFLKLGFSKSWKNARLCVLKKGGKILHIVLNNSSKFNLTFRRVEKKTEKNSKKENKFQKRKKKVLKKLCCVWFFFLWEDRLDFF